MLAAETAVLIEFKTIRIVLLVLGTVIVSLFAFAANECNLYSHCLKHLPVNYKCFTSLVCQAFLYRAPKNGHNKKAPAEEVS